jgi:hypothetical protein
MHEFASSATFEEVLLLTVAQKVLHCIIIMSSSNGKWVLEMATVFDSGNRSESLTDPDQENF